MNLHVMNLLTVMMVENDLMLMMVESVKNKEWVDGLAYILWEKLIKKFKPSDQVAKAEQTAKLLSLKLKKGEARLNWSWGLLGLNTSIKFHWTKKSRLLLSLKPLGANIQTPSEVRHTWLKRQVGLLLMTIWFKPWLRVSGSMGVKMTMTVTRM